MTVRQTSLLAYSEIRGKLGERQREVLDCITVYGPIDNKAISRRLKLPINSITPRVGELRKKNLVKLDRTDVGVEGRRVMF